MIVEFDLTYRGELASSGNPSGKNHNRIQRCKHSLRLHFDKQLQRLFATPLVRWNDEAEQKDPAGTKTLYEPENYLDGNIRTVAGEKFAVLADKREKSTCDLDIVLLRSWELPIGDLDGKLKTIFDALTLPNEQQVKAGKRAIQGDGEPESDPQETPEGPILCVLEDDHLITAVSARYGYLLDAKSQDDVLVLIRVAVKPGMAYRA